MHDGITLPPRKPPQTKPHTKPPDVDALRPVNNFVSPLNVMEFYKKVGGSVATKIDEHVFEDKVVEPAKEVVEEFLEEKLAKFPIKKVTGGAGLFIIEHTIISHTSANADPGFVTVKRPNGTTYRYADLSFQPRRLARGERPIDAPAGTLFYVSPADGSATVIPANSPLAYEVLKGSIKPENIRPVNAKALDNEERAEGIRRVLVSERADP